MGKFALLCLLTQGVETTPEIDVDVDFFYERMKGASLLEWKKKLNQIDFLPLNPFVGKEKRIDTVNRYK